MFFEATCQGFSYSFDVRKRSERLAWLGSTLYNTSKFLTDILSPLQNRNGYSVAKSLQFSKELSDIEIDDNI